MKRMAVHQIGIKWDKQNPTKTSCFTLPPACEGKKGGESGLVINERKTLFLIQSKLPPP
jgi:hypothetical protein